MRPSVFLSIALLGAAACDRGGTTGERPPDAGQACAPDPEAPNHPGCVEFVYPDSRSETQRASEVADSIKFVDGKPVVKIVNNGQCILQLGVNGELLKSTHMAYSGPDREPGASDSSASAPQKPSPPAKGEDLPFGLKPGRTRRLDP